MHKSYIGIKNEAASKTLELHFTDMIYDGFNWETWETTNLVQDTIDKIKEADPDTIKVVINSLGGDVMVGLGLFNYIKGHKATKEVDVIGFAASIASVIACVADPGKLRMAKSSFMIIHQAWSFAGGTAADMREQAAVLDKISLQIAGIYADRSGKKAEDFTALWAEGDYWMTAEEAKEIGIADEVTNVKAKANACIGEYPFKNTPQQFRAASDQGQSPADEARGFFTILKNDLMSIVKTLQNSISGAKTDEKNKDVTGRDAVLDMVEAALRPVLDEFETTIKNLVPKATTETPPADPPKEDKPKEEAPKEDPNQAKVKQLEAELEAVKNQIAASKLKPEEGEKKSPKANLKFSASYMDAD